MSYRSTDLILTQLIILDRDGTSWIGGKHRYSVRAVPAVNEELVQSPPHRALLHRHHLHRLHDP